MKFIKLTTLQKIVIIFWSVMLLHSCKGDSRMALSSDLANSSVTTLIKNSDKNGPITIKELDFYLPATTKNQIIRHNYYTLSYDEKAEQADWVAYELNNSFLKNNDFKRPYFINDPLVKTKSADWRNYKQSGYDKGHLCPAGDMEFDINAYNETFYTSNISPQLHDFNSGIWNRLEQKVRFWATKYNRVIVITGGILKNYNETIGSENVVVPKLFYKIVLTESNGNYNTISFLMPNKKTDNSIFDYVVSIDSIEKISGIDFFPKLDDKTGTFIIKQTLVSDN